MLCNSYSKRFCDFYIFPILGKSAINFQSQKTGNPPFFQGVFSLQKKWNNYLISIFINYTIWLSFLCRSCVSIVQGFPSRAFLKQHLVHSSARAKTILALKHQTAATNIPWTGGQRRTLKWAKQSARTFCPLLKLLLIKKIYHLNTLTPCTSTQRKRTKTRKRTKKELPNSYIKLLNYRHPIVRFLQKTRAWCRSKSL